MHIVSDNVFKDYSYQGRTKLRFKDYDNIKDLIVKASTDSFIKTTEVSKLGQETYEEETDEEKDEDEDEDKDEEKDEETAIKNKKFKAIEKAVENYFTKEYIKHAQKRSDATKLKESKKNIKKTSVIFENKRNFAFDDQTQFISAQAK